MIQPFHQRLAELWVRNKQRPLSPEEMTEVSHCLVANVKYCWQMSYLENLSLMASMVGDVDWQHEICSDIDRLEKIKKPGPRKKRNTGEK